jgi:5-(carboxyamino)imidazole ribonucleotide mutase
MPAGVPVATVAIDGSANAAILAAQMIALSDDTLAAKLAAYKKQMADDVIAKDEALNK